MPAKLTDEQRNTIRAEYARGGVSQRQLSRMFGVSQPVIHAILHEVGIAPDPPPEPIPATGNVVPLRPASVPDQTSAAAPPAVDKLSLGPIADLEQRIREMDALADAATLADSYGPATSAASQAAKLRMRLDVMRATEAKAAPRPGAEEDDESLMDALVAAIEDLPDEAFERIEDAVARRRRVGDPDA